MLFLDASDALRAADQTQKGATGEPVGKVLGNALVTPCVIRTFEGVSHVEATVNAIGAIEMLVAVEKPFALDIKQKREPCGRAWEPMWTAAHPTVANWHGPLHHARREAQPCNPRCISSDKHKPHSRTALENTSAWKTELTLELPQ